MPAQRGYSPYDNVMFNLPGPVGDVYFVDPTSGNNAYGGRSRSRAFATLAAAEDACTAGQHDTVVLSNFAWAELTETLLWDKDYTHLIGLCAPTGIAQRARIQQELSAINVSPLLDITASGCIFKDFYIFQGPDDVGSLINVLSLIHI